MYRPWRNIPVAIRPDVYKRQAVVHLYRLAIGTFATLFLSLHAIHLPVGHLVETYFISYMMLDGHGIDTPRSRSIVGIETIGGICACCPDVFKGAATVVGHPQTPIPVSYTHLS